VAGRRTQNVEEFESHHNEAKLFAELTSETDIPPPMPQAGPQEKSIRASFVEQLLFGGARGGGKSYYLLLDFATDVNAYGRFWRGILFRHTYAELDELIELGKQVFFTLFPGTEFKVGAYEFRFPNGAILRLRHLNEDKDAEHYQGHSYPWIGFDELPNWPSDTSYRKLKACLRSAYPIPNKRIRCTGNPGGPGHQWVRQYFQIPRVNEPDGVIIDDEDGERMFIRSLVTDNKILMRNDPKYIDRLKGVGDDQLVRAWLEGDWDSFVGQYFTSWDAKAIEVQPFEVPDTWPFFASVDYGETAPTSFGLYTTDFDGITYRFCEYYSTGDKRSASEHAYHINVMLANCPFISPNRRPNIIYCDPSMFVKRMLTEQVQHSPADIFAENGLYLTPASRDRVPGWRVVNDYLVNKRFKTFAGWNEHLMRTAPAAPRSKKNPEDIDTTCEDHALDELRYALVNTYQPSKRVDLTPKQGPFNGQHVINEMTALQKRKKVA